MRKAKNSIFLASLVAVLLTIGTASAFTHVTGVSPNADFKNGPVDTIEVVADIVCEAANDYVVFEAMQTQGRYIGVAASESDPCTGTETIPGPIELVVFDGLSFRNGPFTLLVKVYNSTGQLVYGQGFQLKGK